MMVHAKNYETASTILLKLCRKNCGFFFMARETSQFGTENRASPADLWRRAHRG